MHIWGFILACTLKGPGIKGGTIKLWNENVKEDLHCLGLQYLWYKSSGQGRVEGCHRTSAASHLTYGLETV